MTTISKNVYFDVLDDMLINTTIHTIKTIKMKPADVGDVGDHVRISKLKNVFAKGYTPNWSEEIFVLKKIKNTVPWTYIKIMI